MRPSSCYLYLPCRTAQVLAPAALLKGGIRVWLDSQLLQEHNILDPSDVNLALEIRDGGKKYLRHFRFDMDACVTLHIYFDAVFALLGPTGSTFCSCKVNPDGMFRIYFPGDYTVHPPGYLESDIPKRPFKAAKLSKERSQVPSLSVSHGEIFDPSFDVGLVYPDAMVLGPSTSQLLEEMPSPVKARADDAVLLAKKARDEKAEKVEKVKVDFESRKKTRSKNFKELPKKLGILAKF